MSTMIYYGGGYESAAPMFNQWRQWNDATQTYTEWDTSGNVITTRPYNAQEIAAYNAQQAVVALAANQATLQQKANAALATNQTFLTNAATVTYPLTTTEQTALVNQVAALTRQVNALIYLTLQEFSSTTGT